MEKVISVRTTKDDYNKVMSVIRLHSKRWFRVVSHETHNDIIFACSIWKFNRCKRALKLTQLLGIDIEVEIWA